VTGLTSSEMVEIRLGDWETAGPIRLDVSLPLGELQGALFFRRARVLLRAIREQGRVAATADGQLDPYFVADLLPSMEWPPLLVEQAMSRSRVVNGRLAVAEGEVHGFQVLRRVFEAARLLERRDDGFHLTAQGDGCVDDAAAGRFFARLFRAAVRDFDFRTIDSRWHAPEPIDMLVLAMYLIGRVSADWADPDDLAWSLLVARGIQGPPSRALWTEAVIRTEEGLLEPLQGFGLLERRDLPPRSNSERTFQLRKTPLFDRFLRFDLVDPPVWTEPRRPSPRD
jgi:hypothetical protein